MRLIKKSLTVLLTFAIIFTSMSFAAFAEGVEGEELTLLGKTVYYCGMEEHQHNEACYDKSQAPICGQEHEHNYTCYPRTCGLDEHTHDATCEVNPAYAQPYTIYVKNLNALPDYKSVTVLWEPYADAESYVITRNGVVYRTLSAASVGCISYNGVTYCSFRDTNNAKDTTYTYSVQANMKPAAKSEQIADPGYTESSAARVRTAYYWVTFKKAVTLKSHDKAKKKVKFKKGQKVRAEGFGTGAYQFYYNGRLYNAKRIRMTNKATGNYSPNAYNTAFANLIAENLVNHYGRSSATGKLIWANLYSQRVFVFQGYTGHWRVVKNFTCGSGKAKSPSPTGWSKKIGIQQKNRKGHGKKYWSTYSSWNSFHNGLPKKAINNNKGYLVSSGCIRLSTPNASWIMSNVPKKSAVIVF